MPSMEDMVVAPEYQGKLEKDDPEFTNTMRSMFNGNGKYKIVILDPSKIASIPHAPTFFSNPTVSESSGLSFNVFDSGKDAYMQSKKLLDEAKDKHIAKGNQYFNMYALVLMQTKSGKSMVKGFIHADVNKFSTNYFVAENPHDTTLNVVKEAEQEM